MPNIQSTTDTTQAGYFRIGFVVLQIPPTDISCNRVTNDDQISTLRGQSPMFVKSGQARWDVTVRWKAIRFPDDTTQWTDLQNIVAMFKAAPFVEIENAFLRQHFTGVQSAYATQRMAFAMKQLRVDTNPDTTDVLDVVLTVSLFNYSPYSIDFGYQDSQGASTDADNSTAFKNYISNWIATNITSHPASYSSPPVSLWNSQNEGTIKIKWAEYMYIPFSAAQSKALSPTSAGYTSQILPLVSSGATSAKLPSDIQSIVNSAASAAKPVPIDTAIASALCLQESGGDPLANQGKTGVGLGLFQLVASTAAQFGVVGNAIFDPIQNATAGCNYLSQQLKKFGNYPSALAAYNTGAGYVTAYLQGISIPFTNPSTGAPDVINPNKIKLPYGIPPNGIPKGENPQTYVASILARAGKSNLLAPTPVQSVTGVPPSNPTSTTTNVEAPDPGYLQLVNDAIQYVNASIEGQWYLDHYTEFGAIFLQEHEIDLASADSSDASDFDMYLNQVSVVMVNNLATIPLAALQYPTYQHCGPADTMISINFNSVGDTNANLSEPIHEGILALATMSSQLEDQFRNLRTVFRKVSSIHRSQAVFIENQVLNLLGIEGVMIRGLNTETVPDAVGLAQVTLLGSQYENIFEETMPWAMNGLASQYSAQLKTVMTNGQVTGMSDTEKTAYAKVQAFATAWTALDPAYMLTQLLTILQTPGNILGDMSNTPNTNIVNTQRTNLLNALDLEVTSEVDFSASAAPTGSTGPTQVQSNIYPGLQVRRLSLQNSNKSITYADYFVLSQLPKLVNATEVASLRTQVEAQFAAQHSSILDSMYATLLNWMLATNAQFALQAQGIINSPKFQSQFSGSVSVDGPSANSFNNGHWCYKDLGLSSYNNSPASYMVDYNKSLNTLVSSVLTTTVGTANDTANQVNAPQGVPGNSGSPQSGVSFAADKQGLQSLGGANAVTRMMNIPGYSLNSAFPTFKLYLMEENNQSAFFAFDNFYSYASVMDIEIIKYRDKPDTAIIQITNLAHLLQHRMYDDTAAGKMERLADKFNSDSTGSLVFNTNGSAEPGTGANPTSGITAAKTAQGDPYQKLLRKNLVEGFGETHSRIPLKYFALQTGSKIQVRMGFSNNPDKLYPVFTGQVTDIQGDDILILTCQSFMLELMNIPGTMVMTDSLLGFNFLSGGAAFGGWSWKDSGDTLNVMKTLLSSPIARHFGHWQVGLKPTDPLLKGFTWTEVLGNALASSSNTTVANIGSLLQNGYDRSGENILISSINNSDGTKSNAPAKGRTWFNENPYPLWGSATYHIPKQSKFSVWDLMKDISRRYPWYNLMIRSYGFPFAADATVVFAHPLDTYYSRPPLLGETSQANDTTQGQLFAQWWSTIGSAAWNQLFETGQFSLNITQTGQQIANSLLLAGLAVAQEPLTVASSSGPVGFQESTLWIHNLLTGQPIADLPSIINLPFSVVAGIVSHTNIGGNETAFIDSNFQALYRQWINYSQSDPWSATNRMQPVRRYHLVDHNHIIHNGITVNDKIYNAVKIKDKAPFKFNQNIPDQHTRVLDVTDLINDPEENCIEDQDGTFFNSYCQSFLREEVGMMYQGELIIRGVPEIEPFDIILLNDASTGMVGPIEVDSVIHSFNLENGYISIIRPRLMLTLNELVSLSIIQQLGIAWSTGLANIQGLTQVFDPTNPTASISSGLAAAGLGAGALLVLGAGFAWAPPIGLAIALLGLLAGTGILAYSFDQVITANAFQMMPLSRFGRPWLGGVQGFEISGFAYSVYQLFNWFDAEEIYPLIESWQTAMNYFYDYKVQAPSGTNM